ncbi:MAG: HD domain-containing protein, partial [Verrucomicrobiota bacterium]
MKQSLGPTPERYQLRVQLETLREKTTKTGNPYYQLEFSDGEETLVLRVWNNSPMFPTCGQLLEHGFYELSGDFALGSDGRSIDSHEWQVRGLNEAETEAVLSGSARLREKQALDFDFIERSVKEIADPRLKAVATLFLDRFGERLRRTAAARDYHHARRGGLVEHVSQMMRTAIQICEAYPNLNRDLLVCGVLFHDVGKLWENAYVPQGFTMPYTEVSELLGHIPMGMEVVNRLWREAEEAAKE